MANEVLVAGLVLIVLTSYLVLAILQICASPASAAALQPLKHRLLNFLAAFVVFVNGIFALMHFANPTNAPLVSLTVVLRACVGIVYNLVALNFLIKTFNAIYQSKLKQKAAPKELQTVFKMITWFSIFVMVVCVITAFATQDQYFLELYSTWFVMFAGFMSLVIIFGLVDVIRKLKQMIESVKKMRESMQQAIQRKSGTQSSRGDTDLEQGRTSHSSDNREDAPRVAKKTTTETQMTENEKKKYEKNVDSEEKESDGQKKRRNGSGHGMYEVLLLTTKRLTQTMVATIVFFVCCALTSIIRVINLEHHELYDQLYTASDYVTYIVFVLLLLSIFVVWAWEPFEFKNKEKFTICYLCCIGGDADLAVQKNNEEESQVTKEGSADEELTKWDSRGGSTDPAGDVELISFPLSKAQSRNISVKFVIFNIEVLFQDISLFYTLARNRKFKMEQVSYEQLLECLGSERYCDKINKYLTEWSRNAALFVIHPYCTTSQLEAVLDKLDFLDYFRGDPFQFVKLERQPKCDIDWRSRVIGKDSEYFNLLLDSTQVKPRSVSQSATIASSPSSAGGSYLVGKSGTLQTQTSDTTLIGKKDTSSEQIGAQDSLSPPGGLPAKPSSKKKKSKSRHNRSMHLVILEFIKMFSISNDEILFVDCTDAAIKNIQNINLCKTLKPHSHHAMQLQHHGNKKPRRGSQAAAGGGHHSPQSNSEDMDGFDDDEEEEHWIMTQNIIDMIDAQIGDKRIDVQYDS